VLRASATLHIISENVNYTSALPAMQLVSRILHGSLQPNLSGHGRAQQSLVSVSSTQRSRQTANVKFTSSYRTRCLAAAAVAEPQASGSKPVTFTTLGVDKLFQAGLQKMGALQPSPIQAAALPHIFSKENCAIQSYTGSGKTLAFLLPVMTAAIQRAEALYKGGAQEVPVQALVVAPSQELAMQIVRVAQGLLPNEGRKMVQQCIGGANPRFQAEALLTNKPLIVVGTPGRIVDMVRGSTLRLHHCPVLVLDEADQLLAPAFAEDMAHIHDHCGKRLPEGTRRQTILVSATLTQTVLSRTARWCPEPRYITAGGPAPAVDLSSTTAADAAGHTPAWGWGVKGWDGPAFDAGPRTQGAAGGVEADGLVPTMPPHLRHYFIVVQPQHKADEVRRCVHAMGVNRALVFMNFQQRLKDTMFKLGARKMTVAALHGEMSKVVRANVLNDFRRGRLRALVVSDVVARGLDVADCDAVFNMELPSSAAHYAHRAGRTGRMGAPGAVISLVPRGEQFVIEKLSKKLGVPILEAHTANGELVLGAAPFSFKSDEVEEGEEDRKAKRSGKGDASSSKATPEEASSSSSATSSSVKKDGPSTVGSSQRKAEEHVRSSATVSTSQAASGKAQSRQTGAEQQAGAAEVNGSKRSSSDVQGGTQRTSRKLFDAEEVLATAKGKGKGRAQVMDDDSDDEDDVRPAVDVKEELRKELEELKAEKAAARAARAASGRTSSSSSSSSSRQ